ncbi:T9SS C-terminal target domain-containing protein [Dokdonia sinensis]|uniref:T9SS C-terminal target domain-containing protein n=1 Tax=Dokdonia sinensis TaxID=2479847 RepID=A0A3M0G8U2_9FLAO|nr:T9SS type A sorting domain-containing protein [Dokdonia sinensis]RMB60577.1 T9SS C-terminal target domain-containing protein [Dokdonia sinensis]
MQLRLLLFCFLITCISFSAMGQIDVDTYFPTATATHIATQDGDWDEATTWGSAGIPPDGAIVHIPAGITVNYNHNSTVHIFAIRVDGTFICQEDVASQTTALKFDTFIGTMSSDVQFLANGSTDGEIEVNIEAYDLSNPPAIWNTQALGHFTDNETVKNMEITASGQDRYDSYQEAITSADPLTITRTANGDVADGIGVLGRYNWDPTQVSLGIMTMGDVKIEGKEKLNMSQLQNDALVGTTTIRLAQVPTGWEVGDFIIISSGGNKDAANNGEDRRRITGISGNDITLNNGLSNSHEGRPAEGLHCYVGNLTRNITFQSPNNVPIDERGHFMAMNGAKEHLIKNATFLRMGRTDKSRPTDDFYFDKWVEPVVFQSKISTLGQECAETIQSPVDEISNMRGRYSIHLHKLGAENGANKAEVIGNVVWDNPGWGITQHDSHADISKNVVYKVTGAAIVSESGSETGLWADNLVVNVSSGHDGDVYESSLYYDDILFSGVGLGMKGRAVLCRNNVIANATFGIRVINFNNSKTHLDRLDAAALANTRVGYEVDNFPLSTLGYSKEGDGVIPLEAALILENTIVIDCSQAMKSIERDMGVNHESRSIFKGFKAWGVNVGLAITYQADYTYEDVYISGKNSNSLGIDLWKHSHNQVFNNIKLEDLGYGVKVSKVVLSNNSSRQPKQRNNGFTPWFFIDLVTSNVDHLYKLELDTESAEPSYPYTEVTDNTLIMNSTDFSDRDVTFTILDETAVRVDWNESDPEKLLKFEIDGIITDDLGSYNMGIQQALAQGDLRLGYPTRIYQFASKAKFREYITNNGVYKHPDTNETYIIIEESLPNRLTYDYETFPVRVYVDNAPTGGVFASPLTESAIDLAPKAQMISRFATVSQSSTRTDVTYDDGYSGTNVMPYGEIAIDVAASKAVDGNNNGRINAQYYQRGLVPVGSFSETTVEEEPWYALDFEEPKIIQHIDLWNTVELNGDAQETLSDHFTNFYVLLSNSSFDGMTLEEARCNAIFEASHSGAPIRKFSTDNINLTARYMRIQASGTTKIKLAEVEVIGKSIADTCDNTATFAGGSWSPTIPDENTKAIITEDYNTTDDGNINACELIVNQDVTLTINASNYAKVEHNVKVAGTLIVEHEGSLVQVDDEAAVVKESTGHIEIRKTTLPMKPRDFLFASSPMTTEKRDGVYGNVVDAAAQTVDQAFRVIYVIPENFEADPAVTNFPAYSGAETFLSLDNTFLGNHTANEPMVPGQGLIIYPQDSYHAGGVTTTYDFTYEKGSVNNGVIKHPVQYNGTTQNNFNLLGNPYPSAIDAVALITENPMINEVYFWEHVTTPTTALPGYLGANPSMLDFSMRNLTTGMASPNRPGSTPSRYIASGQGFAIKADEVASATPDVIFNNAMRVTTGNDQYRNEDDRDLLWLSVSLDEYELTSKTAVGFLPQASENIDKGYDSKRLATPVSIYTKSKADEQLGIQARETFKKDMVIPVGVATAIEERKSYRISLDQFQGSLLNDAPIYLIDLKEEVYVNLKEDSYTFSFQSSNVDSRFILVFQEPEILGLTEQTPFGTGLSLVPNPANNVTILSSDVEMLPSSLRIIDVQGRVVSSLSLSQPAVEYRIDVSGFSPGVYFVEVSNGSSVVIKRLLIKR